MAQSRYYLQTLGPYEGVICTLGCLGVVILVNSGNHSNTGNNGITGLV